MKSTYTEGEGISKLQCKGMPSELCSGSGDCDLVLLGDTEVLSDEGTEFGHIWSLSNTRGSWSHVEQEEKKGEFANRY